MLEFRSGASDKLVRRDNLSALPGVFPPLRSPMPASAKIASTKGSLEFCDTLITPDCIFAMYNVSYFDWSRIARLETIANDVNSSARVDHRK